MDGSLRHSQTANLGALVQTRRQSRSMTGQKDPGVGDSESHGVLSIPDTEGLQQLGRF